MRENVPIDLLEHMIMATILVSVNSYKNSLLKAFREEFPAEYALAVTKVAYDSSEQMTKTLAEVGIITDKSSQIINKYLKAVEWAIYVKPDDEIEYNALIHEIAIGIAEAK